MKNNGKLQKDSSTQKKVTKLVREIIGGHSISFVPDELIPQIREELILAKQRAEKDGSYSRCDSIQKIMIQLNQHEKERNKLKSLKQKQRSKSALVLTEDVLKVEKDQNNSGEKITITSPPIAVLDSILDDLLEGLPYQIAETNNIPFLIDRSKDRIEEYLKNGDYFTAQKYENVHVKLAALIEERKREEKIESKRTYLIDILTDFQNQLMQTTQEKKDQLEAHDQKISDSLNKARAEFDISNREFDEKTYGPLPASAKKFSSEYLNHREKQRFLVQSRRYEEAAIFKAEADRMEERELEMLTNEYIQKRETLKQTIQKKQNKALNCILLNGDRTRLKIINEYDQKIRELQRTVENTQARLKLLDSGDVYMTNSYLSAVKFNPNDLLDISNEKEDNRHKKPSIKLPITPKETTTSKLRSSPFITQAPPQLTEKSNNKISNPPIKKPRHLAPVSLDKTELPRDNQISLSFSSESFLSSDDDNKNSEIESIKSKGKCELIRAASEDTDENKQQLQKKVEFSNDIFMQNFIDKKSDFQTPQAKNKNIKKKYDDDMYLYQKNRINRPKTPNPIKKNMESNGSVRAPLESARRKNERNENIRQISRVNIKKTPK